MLASDIYKGINGPGDSFFIGRVASLVESALLSRKKDINVDKLLQAFADAKEYSKGKE